MMSAIEIALKYFKHSNKSDFDKIADLFSPQATYKSGAGESYVGLNNIMSMQRQYHDSFNELCWETTSCNEVKPGVVVIDFLFKGENVEKGVVTYRGVESIIVVDAKIRHIEVKRL